MKTLRFIPILLVTLLLFTSCGGGNDPVAPTDPVVPEKPDVPDKPTSPDITIPSGEEDYFSKGMTFDAEAGEKNLVFNATGDWTLSVASTRSGESWCTVSPKSGKAGENTVKVQVESNPEVDDRSVTLTITAGTAKQTISVSQKQKDALTVTTDKFEVAAEGACIEVEVKANVNYEVIIPDASKKWISRSTKSRGLVASKLLFDVAKSEEKGKREGEIMIKSGSLSETIHIYQSGQKILLLTQDECIVPSAGGTVKVELKSNVDFGVKMPSVDWISEETGSRGISSHTLYYHIQANDGYDNRESAIVFYDKEDGEVTDTLHLIQLQQNALIVGQKTFDVSSEGQQIDVKLSTNVDYEVQVESDWIEQLSSRGLTENVLSFNIKPNKSKKNRTGSITLRNNEKGISERITVSQRTAGKRVVEIVRTDKTTMDTKLTHITLTYDAAGHLTTAKDDEFTYTYQWNDDQTISVQVKRNRNGQKMQGTAILKNSRLVEFRGFKGVVDIFSYDSDGHLTSIDNEYAYTSLEWDGDLLKTVTLDSFSTFFHKEWTLTYDSTMPSRGLTYFYYDCFGGPLDMFLTGTIHYLVIAHRNLLGKFTPYGIKRVSAHEEYDYGSFTHGFDSAYNYTYDNKEYPTHILEEWIDECWEEISYDITWN